MPDKRFQVFISSTFTDLVEERREIIQALLELDCIPAGMEMFPAGNEDAWTMIQRVIDDCDYYLVVIAGRYGSIDVDGVSYTEKEYRYALSKNKPTIAFLHKEPGTIQVNKSELDADLAKKLQVFRELVEKKVVRYWSTPQELGSIVSRSLIRLIKDFPAAGWVKGDAIASEAAQSEILALRAQLAELEAKTEMRADPALVSKLSSSDDKVELNFEIDYGSYGQFEMEWIVTCTWDEVFAVISPRLIDEADTEGLKNRLEEHYLNKESAAIFAEIEEEKHHNIETVRILNDSMDQLIVQYNALGLIERGTKRRPIQDRRNYWKLTRVGEKRMFELKAIRREESV
jgi:hypothetical protein